VSSVDLWHRCLGHPSSTSLLHLFSKFNLSCTNNSSAPSSCEACHKGKHVRLPFPNSCTATYFPFQIVHCDLWTSPIESITGFNYYLILIDDYSHYTWTFPLLLKSDVPSTIHEFYQYVLTQFCLPIQSVQCDNGKEFDNHALRSFFSQHGIVFRLSCPYTSLQNGKAERGNRTITNILRTLLFQGHLPACYWVEAMHTATYLFNRRPSRPLQRLTPYEALFLQPPDYSHLRTFGCLYYPNLSATAPHKLAPRSTMCVLFGYSREHKGYHCLEISSRKIITSHHALFDGFLFPFAHIKSPSSRHKTHHLNQIPLDQHWVWCLCG
jgi:hypothetical protein